MPRVFKWCCMGLSINVMRTRAARQVKGKGRNGDGNLPSMSSVKYVWLIVAGKMLKNEFHPQIQLNLPSSCNLGNKNSSNTHLQMLSLNFLPYKLQENEKGPELPIKEPKCSGNVCRKMISCTYVVNIFINFSY